MQEKIRKQVEDYLSNRLPAGDAAFESLLEEHPADRQLLEEFAHQSEMIRTSLKMSAELAPAPGFYARVMERIEKENTRQLSFWSLFTEPFGHRLIYASMALIVMMGFTLFTADQDELQNLASTPLQMLVDHSPEVHLVGDQLDEDRDRVFVTLTTNDPNQVVFSDEYQ